MLTLIIADAELETVPQRMASDPAIRKYAAGRKKAARDVLLDSNYMHTTIEKYFPGESRRRGRPDIIHILLMVSLESILNFKGGLRVFIHTRNNRVITVSPDVRLPRAYNRFTGLIESLFSKGEITSEGNTLLSEEELDLNGLIEREKTGELIIFSPRGEKRKMRDILPGNGDYTVVIGGFSEGDYLSDPYALAPSYSIYAEELTIWSVASEVICQYERSLDMV